MPSFAPLAHGVGRVYELPLPLPLYLLAAAATVLVSFLIRAFAHDREGEHPEKVIAGPRTARIVTLVLRILGVAGLALALFTGIASPESAGGLTALLFWTSLIVGVVIVSAILAGAWEAADPWATIERSYRLEGAEPRDRVPPWWLGPLLVYGLFWFELVSGKGFDSAYIVAVLVGYSVYAFTMRSTFGKHWGLADPLSILFGFAARAAPLRLSDDGITYRGAVRGLDRDEPMPLALYASVFILLASTTLDNVRETVTWSRFMRDTGLADISKVLVDSIALLLFAGLFFLPFAAAVLVSRRWIGGDLSASDVMRRFGWSLIPIGTAYVVAHNLPLFISGVPTLIADLSDPLERGWNLFGTANLFADYAASPRLIWFLEIGVIVGGHIVGVLVAHRTAVRLSPDRAGAVRSQVALTALMSFFTIATLWLLAQPLVT